MITTFIEKQYTYKQSLHITQQGNTQLLSHGNLFQGG